MKNACFYWLFGRFRLSQCSQMRPKNSNVDRTYKKNSNLLTEDKHAGRHVLVSFIITIKIKTLLFSQDRENDATKRPHVNSSSPLAQPSVDHLVKVNGQRPLADRPPWLLFDYDLHVGIVAVVVGQSQLAKIFSGRRGEIRVFEELLGGGVVEEVDLCSSEKVV